MRILSFLSSPTKLLFFLDTTKLFRNIIQKSRHFFGIGAFFDVFCQIPPEFKVKAGVNRYINPQKYTFPSWRTRRGVLAGIVLLSGNRSKKKAVILQRD